MKNHSCFGECNFYTVVFYYNAGDQHNAMNSLQPVQSIPGLGSMGNEKLRNMAK